MLTAGGGLVIVGEAENEIQQGWHEVDLEGVGEAGEEAEGDDVGDDEGGEEREGGVRPEVAGPQEGEFAAEEGLFGGRWEFLRALRAGGTAVDEPGGEERGEEGEDEA